MFVEDNIVWGASINEFHVLKLASKTAPYAVKQPIPLIFVVSVEFGTQIKLFILFGVFGVFDGIHNIHVGVNNSKV